MQWQHITQPNLRKSNSLLLMHVIHSYAYSNKQFFASNVYLAEKCLATQSTIQKSINRLIAHKFITKEIRCVDGHKKRIIMPWLRHLKQSMKNALCHSMKITLSIV